MRGNEAKIRQLVDICEQYYIKGLNQKAIADSMGISRPSISRLLNQAKKEGIVTVTIHNPYASEQIFERALEERFGLQRVVVVNVPEAESASFIKAQADAATYLLESLLQDGDVLGVMGGTTINQISGQIGGICRRELNIVPLIGGWAPASAMWQANLNVRNFGERWNCRYCQLNAPAFVSSVKAKEALMGEAEIRTVLTAAAGSDVALIGIGNVDRASSICKSGFLTESDMEELWSKGVVTSICNFFLNEAGESIPFSGEERMIGVSSSQLRQVPQVVAVANGVNKASAIVAALKGRWVNTLITGLETAKAILDFER